MKQNQIVALFTRVERSRKKATVAQIFDNSGNAVRRIHVNKIPSGNKLDQVTINYPTIDRV